LTAGEIELPEAGDEYPVELLLGPDGADALKKILGGVSAIAIGLAEVRNCGYSSGHGQARAPTPTRGRRASRRHQGALLLRPRASHVDGRAAPTAAGRAQGRRPAPSGMLPDPDLGDGSYPDAG